MDASSRQPRRWFRFSLRTFFFFVTVCGAALGWQLRVVHERAAVRRWLEFRDATVSLEDDAMLDVFSTVAAVPPNNLPWYRQLLGDQSVCYIYLKSSMPPEAVARVVSAFPEADVTRPGGGTPLSDEQYGAIKQNIAAQRTLQANLRREFSRGFTLPDADLQFFVVQPAPTDAQLCDFAPALADRLEDGALWNFSAEILTTEAAVDWLRGAAQLRELFGASRQIPDAKSKALALHAVSLELLRANLQADPPRNTSASPRDYCELLVDYEMVSSQDQPPSDSPFSPAQRRWHAAVMLGERLCEAAQLALDDGAITPEALVHSWERRRDARLAAADLTDDDAAHRAAWQQFADAVHERQEIVEPLYEQGRPGGEAEKLYLLLDCAATAAAALARLDQDEAAEAAALARAAENSRLLLEATKVAFQAEAITAAEYIDAIGRSIDTQQRLAKLRPDNADVQAWREQQADELHRLTMILASACEGSNFTPYAACHYVLAQLRTTAQAAP